MSRTVQEQTVFIPENNTNKLQQNWSWHKPLLYEVPNAPSEQLRSFCWVENYYFNFYTKKPQQASLPSPPDSLSEPKGGSCIQRSPSSMSREEMLTLKAWDYLAAQHQCSGFWKQQGKGGVYLVLSCSPQRRLRGSRFHYNRRYKLAWEILI